MQSKAKTVQQYLAELPADRRAAISAVRDTILKNLDKDYEETMGYGMISYVVPHRVHPAGYHCDPKQPLPFACLGSQKNHMSLYMMSCYGSGPAEKRFRDAWAKTGKKLDMGKSCIRFKSLDGIALDVVGDAIKRMPAKKYVANVQEALATAAAKRGGKPGAAKAKARPGAKKPAGKASKSAGAGR